MPSAGGRAGGVCASRSALRKAGGDAGVGARSEPRAVVPDAVRVPVVRAGVARIAEPGAEVARRRYPDDALRSDARPARYRDGAAWGAALRQRAIRAGNDHTAGR